MAFKERSSVPDKTIKKMLDRFKLSSDAESENRKRGLAALKFRTGDEQQWDSQMLNQRQADNRPSESYNQIPQFVHQITNDMRQNMPQVRFIPGNYGSIEVAEIYEDLARNIQSSSEAEVAFDTAADSQVTIGWGYFRILTDYENATTFDQIIKIGWIPNAFTVYDDPYAMLQDRSDRKFLIQVCDMPVDDFNSEHDRSYGSIELSSIGDQAPDWSTQDTVRVAEYWTVEEETSKLYRLKPLEGLATDPTVLTELPEGADKSLYETRDVVTPKVVWRKCTAWEVLETKDWPGKYIPYIFVSGEELNVDGQKELSGIVRYMMAPQKQYNYWTNAATEMVALAPKAPFIMAIGQVKGLEKFWDMANVKNYPYLPYNPIDINGTVLGAPQRQQSEAPIQAMMAMVQQAQQNMYTTTGIYPPSLGKQGNEVSGKAIMARQREGDVSTFHFADNMARAVRCLGRMLGDLMPKVYDGARTLRLLKEDKSHREVKVNQPFEDKRGRQKEFDLTVGTYDVAVTTGPSYTTKRQESQEFYTTLVQSYPEIMQVAGDLVVGSSDAAGADKIAERLKAAMPPNVVDEEEQDEIPPQVKQQMQQAQQMIDALTQKVHQQADELESKKGELAIQAADLQAKVMENQQSAQNDQFKAEVKNAQLDLENRALKLQMQEKELEYVKAELATFAKQTANPKPEAPQMEENDMAMSEEALMTQLEVVRQQKAEKEQQMMMRQEQEAMNAEQMAAKEQEDRARSDALLNSLAGIQNMLGGLMVNIAAPKTVVRDPSTGLIQSVVTQGADNGLNG